jgi:hypothetical protein
MTDEINQWQLAIPVIEQVKRGERKRVIEEVRKFIGKEFFTNPHEEILEFLTKLEAGAE